MSSTRHAQNPGTFRQERYSSSTELNHGLMANLVAKRCSVLSDARDRELIWFLQYLSHERGLKELAAELLELHPEQIATRSMQKFGLGGHYNGEQVCAIRKELPKAADPFAAAERVARSQDEAEYAHHLRALHEGREVVFTKHEQALPTCSAQKFVELCRSCANTLPDYIAELCLDPAVPVDGGPFYFPHLISSLRDYMDAWAAEAAARVVVTEVSRKVAETLDYTLKMRCLTLTEGIEGIGKTWSAENVCLQRPGQWRYVQVPATDDECGFYREIAKALGVSINLNSKARELRERIEDAFQAGDLGIVFDEAHWLFGINSTRGGLPKRMLWVLTALVNKHVPVAFVATPQFEKNQSFIKKNTRWRDGQLIGRIDHHEKLPTTLSKEELAAVVRAKLPAADAKAVTAVALFARNSDRCLGALSAVVRRAEFLAQKNNRTEPTRADINTVILEKGFAAQQVATPAVPLPQRAHTAAAPLPETRRTLSKLTARSISAIPA